MPHPATATAHLLQRRRPRETVPTTVYGEGEGKGETHVVACDSMTAADRPDQRR
ncbi:hypothetical protein ACFVJH_10390 [Streptomyces decoyicus]|uniref:hypothetical protein n=1 Tax=Streptomyces decoyicus TaxID=249567 RepID=UPI0036271D53